MVVFVLLAEYAGKGLSGRYWTLWFNVKNSHWMWMDEGGWDRFLACSQMMTGWFELVSGRHDKNYVGVNQWIGPCSCNLSHVLGSIKFSQRIVRSGWLCSLVLQPLAILYWKFLLFCVVPQFLSCSWCFIISSLFLFSVHGVVSWQPKA